MQLFILGYLVIHPLIQLINFSDWWWILILVFVTLFFISGVLACYYYSILLGIPFTSLLELQPLLQRNFTQISPTETERNSLIPRNHHLENDLQEGNIYDDIFLPSSSHYGTLFRPVVLDNDSDDSVADHIYETINSTHYDFYQ